jgi:hypothetical protein
MGYLREYLAFASAELGPVMSTRLGNALRAAQSYPGGDERWDWMPSSGGHACAYSVRTAPEIRSTRPGHRWTSRQASATR